MLTSSWLCRHTFKTIHHITGTILNNKGLLAPTSGSLIWFKWAAAWQCKEDIKTLSHCCLRYRQQWALSKHPTSWISLSHFPQMHYQHMFCLYLRFWFDVFIGFDSEVLSFSLSTSHNSRHIYSWDKLKFKAMTSFNYPKCFLKKIYIFPFLLDNSVGVCIWVSCRTLS